VHARCADASGKIYQTSCVIRVHSPNPGEPAAKDFPLPGIMEVIMIRRVNRFTSIVAFVAIVMMVLAGTALGADKRPAISDGERAVATIMIQNLMSKHEYYHAAGLNLQEVIDLWVAEDGPNAKTAAFFSPAWVMQGVAAVKAAYGEGHAQDKITAFKALQEAYPELADLDPETADIGGEFAMHTSTTPVIEIAGDGKTAKGMWYSPGIGLTPHANGKSVTVGSIFFWEKYAGDFIKENGVWKIWHLGMSYDFTPGLPESMTANLGNGVAPQAAAGEEGARAGAPPAQQDNREKGERMTPEEIAAGGMLPNPYKYEAWKPTRKNVVDPIFPEPYYTFSETFSYAPYDENNYHNPEFNPEYNNLYYNSLKK